MAKFNQAVRTGVQSPIKTTGIRTKNADGKDAFERDAKSELFLLAVANFVGQDTFYESAKNRDDRFASLCRIVVLDNPSWFMSFVMWLRNDANMRSASIVAAAEGAKALLEVGSSQDDWKRAGAWPRAIVGASMARADEPGEFLAYWTSKFGKNLPQAVKKGVADAATRLYSEYSLLKYDTDSKGFRFADVLQLSHAKAKDAKQNDLFSYALNRRYGTDEYNEFTLKMVAHRDWLMQLEVPYRRKVMKDNPQMLKDAGMTWEAVSGWLQGPMDKAAWEAVIPSMGYMALLRNLRNFQQAGVSQQVFNGVLHQLANEAAVAKSRQFPFRFLAAYQANRGNLKIAAAMEEALNYSLSNVPALSGRTLILVDRSGSMFWSNDKSMELTLADQAAVFGSALALRAESATLVAFGSSSKQVSFRKGDSILPMLDKFGNLGGTATNAAIQKWYAGHDRVILITDEQYNSGSAPKVPANVPMYTWNLGGYRAAHAESGKSKKHTFGGLTDKAWQMIPLLEAGQTGQWPWDMVN